MFSVAQSKIRMKETGPDACPPVDPTRSPRGRRRGSEKPGPPPVPCARGRRVGGFPELLGLDLAAPLPRSRATLADPYQRVLALHAYPEAKPQDLPLSLG